MPYTPPPKPAGLPKNTHSGAVKSDSGDPIQKNMETKNLAIARANALNNSMLMVKAYQEACQASGIFNGLKEAEIKLWLTSLKKSEFVDNLKMLGIDKPETIEKDVEIPF